MEPGEIEGVDRPLNPMKLTQKKIRQMMRFRRAAKLSSNLVPGSHDLPMKSDELPPLFVTEGLLLGLPQDMVDGRLTGADLDGDFSLGHTGIEAVADELGPVHESNISTLICAVNSDLLEKTNNMRLMSIGHRIRQLREKAGLSQSDLAIKAGVSQGTISQLEKNPNQKTKHLVAIARALDASVDWLEKGTGPIERQRKTAITPDDSDEFIAIRKVVFRISAGVAGFAVDFLDNGDGAPLFFQKTWFATRGYDPDDLYAIKVRGASMEPSLADGDTVVVNTEDKTPMDGEVFAANYDGELVVKRLVRDAGEWWLSSDNRDERRYPRKRCDEHTFILGRIVHKQSERI
jgi:phage repressor protein C with HTH and peptisase S24 domain